MAEQTDFNALETEFLSPGKFSSELVIAQHVQKMGGEYRQELQGPHPVERFRLQ